MDNTESDQEASTQSSPEDISRQIDLRALGSPTFEPLSLVQIERPPPEEETDEEERESSESETETPRLVSLLRSQSEYQIHLVLFLLSKKNPLLRCRQQHCRTKLTL